MKEQETTEKDTGDRQCEVRVGRREGKGVARQGGGGGGGWGGGGG